MKIQDLKKKIEAENEIFNNMSSAEKRVVIAQDCLARIHMNQISVKTGTFLCGIDGNPFYHTKNLSEKSIQDEINSDENFSCRACAKGSLFMSYVGRVNKVIFAEVKDNNSINDNDHKKLLEIFSAEQLALIEFVFEGRQFLHHTINKRNEMGNFIKGDDIIFSKEVKEIFIPKKNELNIFAITLLTTKENLFFKQKITHHLFGGLFLFTYLCNLKRN